MKVQAAKAVRQSELLLAFLLRLLSHFSPPAIPTFGSSALVCFVPMMQR
jgi:hypothetical protein